MIRVADHLRGDNAQSRMARFANDLVIDVSSIQDVVDSLPGRLYSMNFLRVRIRRRLVRETVRFGVGGLTLKMNINAKKLLVEKWKFYLVDTHFVCIRQLAVPDDEFESRVDRFEVQIAHHQSDITRVGHVDELAQFVGLQYAMRQIQIVGSIVLGVQLKNFTEI